MSVPLAEVLISESTSEYCFIGSHTHDDGRYVNVMNDVNNADRLFLDFF